MNTCVAEHAKTRLTRLKGQDATREEARGKTRQQWTNNALDLYSGPIGTNNAAVLVELLSSASLALVHRRQRPASKESAKFTSTTSLHLAALVARPAQAVGKASGRRSGVAPIGTFNNISLELSARRSSYRKVITPEDKSRHQENTEHIESNLNIHGHLTTTICTDQQLSSHDSSNDCISRRT